MNLNKSRAARFTLTAAWQMIRTAAAGVRCTLWISVAAILATGFPAASAMLELKRQAVADGHFWRLLTGHLAHFGADHLLWDVMMFVALGSVCEWRWPRSTRIALLASAMAISLAVLIMAPGVQTYRGLSGIDSALFGLVAASLRREEDAKRSRLFSVLLWALLAGFAAKIGYELLTGTTFFVDSQTAGFVPVPLAHAVGFIVGVICSHLANPALVKMLKHVTPASALANSDTWAVRTPYPFWSSTSAVRRWAADTHTIAPTRMTLAPHGSLTCTLTSEKSFTADASIQAGLTRSVESSSAAQAVLRCKHPWTGMGRTE
jgi:rhomboid family GlyGly-CTERM serine protease